ncbi:MAG: DUF2073 domain-containing protein [Methanotrichaceae archaeon]
MDLISAEKLDSMSSENKIRFILSKVKTGKIVVLENGLSPEDEAKLITMTMTEIGMDEFSGIEIETYPTKNEGSFVDKIRGKSGFGKRMMVVGPANQLRTIEKGKYQISTKVLVGD